MAARILPFFTRPSWGADEREFLPAALEIVETPASPTLRITAAVIVLCLVTAFIWSFLGHVDIVATAPGKIIARERTKIIQPFETGVVRAIHVADGDQVEVGQALLELDPTLSEADRTRYREVLLAARLDQARLGSLLSGSASDPFAGISAPPDLVDAARARLEAERREESSKLAQLDHQMAQKRAEQAGSAAQIAKIDASLPLVRGRAQIRGTLMDREFGSKYEYLEAQQQVVEMEHERVAQQRKEEEALAGEAEITSQRAQTEAEYKRKRLEDLAKANHDASEAADELAKAEKRTELQSLTAPVAGVVQDLSVHTLGGVVTPAQQLLRIVPSHGGIEVDAIIANQDVGFVAVGQEAEIKVETFPYTRYGLIRGRVREIASDAVTEPQDAQPPTNGSQSASDQPTAIERSQRLVYMARIELEQTSLNVEGRSIELAPGMAITAEIKTGRRRVLDFLLSPLQSYAHDSLRER